ncbi:hypothetical protein ACJJTC_016891 [Scirpophaga incertulas]
MFIHPELSVAVQEINNECSRNIMLVLLGTTSSARSRLLHSLLGRKLLPDEMPRGCRWIRVQFGVTTQVHLTLGNSEFELVEELVCNKKAWETEISPSRLNNPLNDRRRLGEEQSAFMSELLDQWELMSPPPPKHYVRSQFLIIDDEEILKICDEPSSLFNSPLDKSKRDGDTDRVLKSRTALSSSVRKFATDCLQTYLLQYCTRLSEVHVKLLQHFILASFDMARELQVVPKKIQYVARQEHQLYETIHEKFSSGDKKQELVQMMQQVLQEMRRDVDAMDWSVDELPWHQDHEAVALRACSQTDECECPASGFASGLSSGLLCTAAASSASDSASDGEEAESYGSYSFDDYDIINSNDECFAADSRLNNVSNTF